MTLKYYSEVLENCCDFKTLVKKKTYIDKSLLIKWIFDNPTQFLFTAPNKFFKSSNLSMIREFLEIKDDENETNTEDNVFKGLTIYQNNNIFFKKNYHKHPVMFVSFTSGNANTYDEALNSYRWAIHKAYQEYERTFEKYGKLPKARSDWFNQWITLRSGFTRMHETDICNALALLVSMLKSVYKKTVVVLIDGYDSVLNKALQNDTLSTDDLKRIRILTCSIFEKLLKDNKDVRLSVTTGVSLMSTSAFQDNNIFEAYPFLGKHKFVEFFGFAESDIQRLAINGLFKEWNVNAIKEMHGGYFSRTNQEMFNPYSILMYIKNGKTGVYTQFKDYIRVLVEKSHYQDVANTIHHLLQDGKFENNEEPHCSVTDIRDLKQLFSIQSVTDDTSRLCLIFSHALEQGVLSYDLSNKKHGDNMLVIPNNTVKTVLSNQFQYFVIRQFKLTDDHKKETYKEFLKCMNEVGSMSWNYFVSKDNTIEYE